LNRSNGNLLSGAEKQKPHLSGTEMDRRGNGGIMNGLYNLRSPGPWDYLAGPIIAHQRARPGEQNHDGPMAVFFFVAGLEIRPGSAAPSEGR
jgi:hypothetical protein